jgi:ribosomal protein L21
MPVPIFPEKQAMYAIIEEGGRQFKVTGGDTILIDREAGDEKTIKFDRVLLIAAKARRRSAPRW